MLAMLTFVGGVVAGHRKSCREESSAVAMVMPAAAYYRTCAPGVATLTSRPVRHMYKVLSDGVRWRMGINVGKLGKLGKWKDQVTYV